MVSCDKYIDKGDDRCQVNGGEKCNGVLVLYMFFFCLYLNIDNSYCGTSVSGHQNGIKQMCIKVKLAVAESYWRDQRLAIQAGKSLPSTLYLRNEPPVIASYNEYN